MTSRLSSEPNRRLMPEGQVADRAGQRSPMVDGAMPPTKPAHGVMATRPATAPDAAPRVVAWPLGSRLDRRASRAWPPTPPGTCS